MKTEKEISFLIKDLNKDLKLVAKHHNKYIMLKDKILSHWWTDLLYLRSRKYSAKIRELYFLHKEMSAFKKGLQWTLSERRLRCIQGKKS